ncbi:DNA helicase Pif1-like [Cinara cedri]|uniref:DNA helicase Pif1-like n=1 Tax=Cinara cedri TaxID=506608 RepID=A0A5E4MQB1_9HEMI|nr:DNA helicase Pif1-like [Cinara cedri]
MLSMVINIHKNNSKDLCAQYINHVWLTERAISKVKNVDVDDLNFKIQQSVPGDLVSYKSVDTVCDADEAVNYPTVFELTAFARHATTPVTESWMSGYFTFKFEPTTIVQWHVIVH